MLREELAEFEMAAGAAVPCARKLANLADGGKFETADGVNDLLFGDLEAPTYNPGRASVTRVSSAKWCHGGSIYQRQGGHKQILRLNLIVHSIKRTSSEKVPENRENSLEVHAVKVVQLIEAPPVRVFAIASNFSNSDGVVKAIVRSELLTAGPIGVGTRFKETRKMFGKEATEEFEVTAFDPPTGFELAVHSCGAEVKSQFRCFPEGSGTRLEVDMIWRNVTFLAKLMSPLTWMMSGMMRKCVEQDLKDIKVAAEGKAAF